MWIHNNPVHTTSPALYLVFKLSHFFFAWAWVTFPPIPSLSKIILCKWKQQSKLYNIICSHLYPLEAVSLPPVKRCCCWTRRCKNLLCLFLSPCGKTCVNECEWCKQGAALPACSCTWWTKFQHINKQMKMPLDISISNENVMFEGGNSKPENLS